MRLVWARDALEILRFMKHKNASLLMHWKDILRSFEICNVCMRNLRSCSSCTKSNRVIVAILMPEQIEEKQRISCEHMHRFERNMICSPCFIARSTACRVLTLRKISFASWLERKTNKHSSLLIDLREPNSLAFVEYGNWILNCSNAAKFT